MLPDGDMFDALQFGIVKSDGLDPLGASRL
jgi:hypothetical protein